MCERSLAACPVSLSFSLNALLCFHPSPCSRPAERAILDLIEDRPSPFTSAPGGGMFGALPSVYGAPAAMAMPYAGSMGAMYPGAMAYGGYTPQAYTYQAPYGGGYGGAAVGPYPGAAAVAGGGGYGGSGAGWMPGSGAGAPAGGALPAPWKEIKDDQGRTYFYNTITGASQWEKPIV
jgi:far upstream element-binding protein